MLWLLEEFQEVSVTLQTLASRADFSFERRRSYARGHLVLCNEGKATGAELMHAYSYAK